MKTRAGILGKKLVLALSLVGACCGVASASLMVPSELVEDSKPTALAPVRVVVSIAPLRGLVESLLPSGSSVEVLIPPGVSEHGYEIPPARLAMLARADLVITAGAGLEPMIDKFLAANPRGQRVHVELATVAMATTRTSGDAGKGDVPKPHEHAHDDGASCSVCAHGEVDPHAWLDPIAAIALVNTLSDRLIALRPLSTASSQNAVDSPAEGLHPIRVRADAMIGQLDQLHREFAAQTKVLKGVPLIVAHDAYRWLGRRYDLTFVPIAGLTASEPKPAQLKRAIDAARQSRARVIFVEPQTNPQAAERVAESVGARLATLDPLGSGSYVQMMRANLAAILQAAAQGLPGEPGAGQSEAKAGSASP